MDIIYDEIFFSKRRSDSIANQISLYKTFVKIRSRLSLVNVPYDDIDLLIDALKKAKEIHDATTTEE